jgi:hypothetical protein
LGGGYSTWRGNQQKFADPHVRHLAGGHGSILACLVMIGFGASIEPRRWSHPGMDRPEVTDPSTQVAFLPGLLSVWQ